jgi:hypothetical protein
MAVFLLMIMVKKLCYTESGTELTLVTVCESRANQRLGSPRG